MKLINFVMKLNDALKERSCLDDVYEACHALDMVGAVITALRVLHNTRKLPEVTTTKKCEHLSHSYRMRGKTFFNKLKHRAALEFYNKALLHAPNDSEHLVSAYYDRSLLLYELKAYAECLVDIETCFQFQCGKELLKRLNNKKEECEKMISENEHSDSINKFNKELADIIFKVKGKSHPEIPCLSADADVIIESGKIKAVAIKDIPVGTVLALETAYTTDEQEKSFLRCYYCQKIALNLTPCKNCCYALFCSNTCNKLCLSEYHLIECQIMDVLRTVDNGSRFRLAIKTVLKLKSQCKRWSTLIEESQNIGANRLKTSSKKELCDVNNYSSILSFNDDRHFIHGALYNSCFAYALVIYHLQKINGFFPAGPKDNLKAQQCLAKLFMTIELMWPCVTDLYNSAERMGHVTDRYKLSLDLPNHYGFFSFTSKLKHACEPNILQLGLNNQLCLIAMEPIKQTSELKISHIGNWLSQPLTINERMKKMFCNSFTVCNCRLCKGDWNRSMDNIMKFMKTGPIEDTQIDKTILEHLQELLKDRNITEEIFSKTCRKLTTLNEQAPKIGSTFDFFLFCLQLAMCQLISDNHWIVD